MSTLNPNPSSDFCSKLSQARHQRSDGNQFRRVRGGPLYPDPYCGTGAHVVLEMEDCAGVDCDDVFNGGGFGERHCPCIASCIVEMRCRPCGKCTWSVVVPQYPQSGCGPRQYTGEHRLAAIPVIETRYCDHLETLSALRTDAEQRRFEATQLCSRWTTHGETGQDGATPPPRPHPLRERQSDT